MDDTLNIYSYLMFRSNIINVMPVRYGKQSKHMHTVHPFQTEHAVYCFNKCMKTAATNYNTDNIISSPYTYQ